MMENIGEIQNITITHDCDLQYIMNAFVYISNYFPICIQFLDQELQNTISSLR